MQKSMNYFKGKILVSRDLLLLLFIGGLYSLSIFLSNTFVNVYLWKQSGEYPTIAIYNLFVYIFQAITFTIAGKIAKKIDRVLVLRLGVICLSLFFLTVLIIGEKASSFNFVLGSILGIGYGFYWLAFNVLTFEITEPETRDFFNGFLGVLQSVAGMIGPLLAGFIIAKMAANTGYTIIFLSSFILFIGAIVLSFFLKRRKAKGIFHLKKILSERHRNQNWNRILYAHIFQGLREGIYFFVITIWVFLLTKSEFSLGIFNLLLSGFSLLFYFFMAKFVKPEKRIISILIGALLLYFPIYMILFSKSYILLYLYAIIVGGAYPIANVPYNSLTYDVIGQSQYAKELRIEYIVVRELFLNIGRITSILSFLILTYLFPPHYIIPLLLATFGIGYLMIYFFVKNIKLEFSS